jgi:hypothetical protein
MAYKEKFAGDTDVTIRLGGKDNKGKANPTQVEGYFLGSKDCSTDFGPAKLHIFQTPEGNVGVWGKTFMNRLLTDDLKGQMVKVVFDGMGVAQKGRQAPYKFKVYSDADNTVDVGEFDPNASEESEPDGGSDADLCPTADVEEEEPVDEIPPPRPVAPKVAAKTPDAARQAKVQALLAGSRKK